MEMKHRVGGLSLDVSFALTRPWTVLFGPSGSGKTTVLRAIAGFVRPDAGRIVYGPMERVLVSTRGADVCACACEAGAECGAGGEAVSASDGAGECLCMGWVRRMAGAGGGDGVDAAGRRWLIAGPRS